MLLLTEMSKTPGIFSGSTTRREESYGGLCPLHTSPVMSSHAKFIASSNAIWFTYVFSTFKKVPQIL